MMPVERRVYQRLILACFLISLLTLALTAFQIALALFILALIPGLPESPRWLVLKGRDDEALTVLAALSDLDEEDEKVQSEFKAVKDVAFEMSKGGFRDCFRLNRNRNFHRTVLGETQPKYIQYPSLCLRLLGYVNQMFQQISGINISELLQRLSLHTARLY